MSEEESVAPWLRVHFNVVPDLVTGGLSLWCYSLRSAKIRSQPDWLDVAAFGDFLFIDNPLWRSVADRLAGRALRQLAKRGRAWFDYGMLALVKTAPHITHIVER